MAKNTRKQAKASKKLRAAKLPVRRAAGRAAVDALVFGALGSTPQSRAQIVAKLGADFARRLDTPMSVDLVVSRSLLRLEVDGRAKWDGLNKGTTWTRVAAAKGRAA